MGVRLMSLVFEAAIQSLPLALDMADDKYDTLELRNRDVTETLSKVDDFGCNQNPEFDKLELRNRTITETLSPVADLGQDPKPEGAAANGKEEEKKFDELELRNRTVTETLSPLEDLGQDPKVENGGEKKSDASE